MLRSLANNLGNMAKKNSFVDGLIRQNPLYYHRACAVIRRIRTDPESATRECDKLLGRALSWARETEHGKNRGAGLDDWPILTKADLMANPLRFRRRSLFSVASSTGGSTGRPLTIWRSLECTAAQRAMVDSLLGDDASPMSRRRVAVLRADYVKDPADKNPPFGVWRNHGRWLVLSNSHLSRETATWFVRALTSFQPEILWVYPSALSNLLRLAGELDAQLTAKVVLSSSEVLGESLFLFARDALGARVIDLYGHGERACNAYSFTPGEYWFDRAYGRVELIPELDPRPAGAPFTARVIATGYWNSAYPLVRYDTGDLAVLPSGLGPGEVELIARGQQPFHGIIGRANDYVVGPDGQRFTGLNHIPRELESVLQVQVIQDAETSVRLLVIPRGELTSRDRNTLHRNARELLPPEMNIHIEPVESFEALPNGKTPFVIRRSGQSRQ
jgi:phenylacetate-CoA ligase